MEALMRDPVKASMVAALLGMRFLSGNIFL